MPINNALNNIMNQMKVQGMTFDPAIDCRNDLINFCGLSPAQVANMTDYEVFSFLDSIENELNNNHHETECKCETCGSLLFEADYSDYDDCYTLHCKTCNKELRLHYTAYDAWRDSIADDEQFENEACELVKDLCKNYYVSIFRTRQEKEELKTKGSLIQRIETSYDTNEYYEFNGDYYFIGLNSGKFVKK